MAPEYPGEVLLEDFIRPFCFTCYRPAKARHAYPRKVNEIVQGKHSVTAGAALRLARFFGASAEVWMNLQAHHDLESARDAVEETVQREVTPNARL
jgi:antitoxin HigA-1